MRWLLQTLRWAALRNAQTFGAMENYYSHYYYYNYYGGGGGGGGDGVPQYDFSA